MKLSGSHFLLKMTALRNELRVPVLTQLVEGPNLFMVRKVEKRETLLTTTTDKVHYLSCAAIVSSIACKETWDRASQSAAQGKESTRSH